MKNFISVIISGGSGNRLWPVSRAYKPKQFSTVWNPVLYEQTLLRLKNFGDILTVTNKNLKALTRNSLSKLKLYQDILYEPEAKGTAPAVLLAALTLSNRGKADEIMGIFPSDHKIVNLEKFNDNLLEAHKFAVKGNLVLFGLQPNQISTQFGYIKYGGSRVGKVLEFVEKPNFETAKKYMESKNYLMNSGIFVSKVRNIINLFKKHNPKVYKLMMDGDLSNLSEIYKNLRVESFDVSIVEKARETWFIKSDFDLKDMGSLNVLTEKSKNLKVQQNASGNSFYSKNKDKVSVFVDTRDLRVVDTLDAVMISKKDSILDKSKIPKISNSSVRPWGEFFVVKRGENFCIKIIKVNPGHRLSYQSHKKRSEHWVVVKGEGIFTLEGKDKVVKINESVFIPKGKKHRISNKSEETLEFVEIQFGDYLEEDDISRYEDDYGRS